MQKEQHEGKSADSDQVISFRVIPRDQNLRAQRPGANRPRPTNSQNSRKRRNDKEMWARRHYHSVRRLPALTILWV